MLANDVTTEEMRGKRVFDSAGNELGSVDDITFSPEALRVTGFIVKVNREAADRLRLEKPMLGTAKIQVSAERLSSLGDSVLLNIDQREMFGMLYDESVRRP